MQISIASVWFGILWLVARLQAGSSHCLSKALKSGRCLGNEGNSRLPAFYQKALDLGQTPCLLQLPVTDSDCYLDS